MSCLNDRNDARGIAEAVTRPDMKFVSVKNIEQQDVLLLHRARELLMKQRTAAANQIRGLLMEYGVTIPQGICNINKLVAGEIEDTATNSLLVVQHLNKIVDNLYQIMGFELIHASQAIDLKKLQTPDLKLGKSTIVLYSDFRKIVPFLQKDRELTPDIKKAYKFISSYAIDRSNIDHNFMIK